MQVLVIENLIGQEEGTVMQQISGMGMIPRITHRDGQSFILTRDYVQDRVNLEVTEGKITNVKLG